MTGDGAGGRLRCAPHDLACDAEGRCVLCRRAAGLASEPPQAPSSRAPAPARGGMGWALVGGVVGVVAAGIAMAFVLVEPEPPVAPAVAAPVPEAAPAPEGPSAEARARQARAEARARAEQMLREAEAQRMALERRAALEAGRAPDIPSDPGALSDSTASSGASNPTADRDLDRRVAELRDAREREQHARAVARARERVQILMYSAKWCGVCTRARRYMRAEGIAFTERDVDESAAARAVFHRLNPRRTLPTLDIDGNVVTGFSPASFKRHFERAVLARVR